MACTGATVDDLDSSNLDKHVQHDFEINRSMKRVAKARFGPGHDVGGRRVAWPHLDTVWCDETGDGAYGPNGELVWTDGLQAVRRKPYSDTLLRDLMQASVSLPVPGLTRMRQTMESGMRHMPNGNPADGPQPDPAPPHTKIHRIPTPPALLPPHENPAGLSRLDRE